MGPADGLPPEFHPDSSLQGVYLAINLDIGDMLSLQSAGLASELLPEVLFGEVSRARHHLRGDPHHEVPSRLERERPDGRRSQPKTFQVVIPANG
jgi:hypothetical protein